MKFLLSIILALCTFLACYAENIYLYFEPPQPDKPAMFTVRADRAFNFDQEKALGEKRKLAVSQYVPLYTHVPDNAESAKKKMAALINKVSELQDRKQSGKELAKYLQKQFNLEISGPVAAKLLRYPNFKNLLAGLLTIEESILKSKIVEDPEPLKGKINIDVHYPGPAGTLAHPTSDLITLEDARLTLLKKAGQIFWQVDKKILNPVVQISLATLRPNLQYDKRGNDRRIEEIIQRYPSRIIPYQRGDVLVPFRKVLDEKDVLLLTAYQEEKKALYGGAPWILVTIVFVVVLYNLFLSKILTAVLRRQSPCELLLCLLILTIFLLKASLLFTPFPVYVIPLSLLPLLLILLNQERVSATCTTVVGAMLVSLFCGRTFDILLFFVFGGVVAVLASPRIRKRAHILVPSLVVGLVNSANVMAFSMDWEAISLLSDNLQGIGISSLGEFFSPALVKNMGWAFAGGLIAGPAAILFLPMLDLSRHTASTLKLNRYIDLQHPLMRDLLTKTPGTYQHTMTVAYLCQAVAEAVEGVNSLILRIGAYYHDVGKITHPKLFVENQFSGKNPHDDLDPQESSKIVIKHVRNGIKTARDAGLPEVVIDLISQHHGTQLMEYFYNKSSQAGETKMREEVFRYPGPKPRSVEAAILMIVDSVEAASRSLHEPTRQEIGKMVRHLIEIRVADGQFDECDLSTHDLAKIVRILVHSIEASFHSRVVYPWQEEEGPNTGTPALKTESATSGSDRSPRTKGRQKS
jgi:putative nucleotidyltransferase with HDIG domain